MNPTPVEEIASALLYEGYLLYPYRPSALKNQRRCNFGVVHPGAYMQTECVLTGGDEAAIDVKVRFLQLAESGAVERETGMSGCPMQKIAYRPIRQTFTFPKLEGAVDLLAERAGAGIFRITARILNLSPEGGDSPVSTHTILTVKNGAFISLLDPPDSLRDIASRCQNAGTWPVLVGQEGQRDTLLSSPIILYDYPRIAPESTGDLFDSTEIDEMLALRIMTLTEDEKREMRESDERARRILERVESLSPDRLLKLHGRLDIEDPTRRRHER
jgi:hypothetical protein